MIRRAELLAWMLAILAIVLLVAAAVVGVSAGHPVDDVAGVGLVFSIGLPVLGAVVIRQREGGAIGWLMIGMGLSIALASLGRWARAALVDEPGSPPGGARLTAPGLGVDARLGARDDAVAGPAPGRPPRRPSPAARLGRRLGRRGGGHRGRRRQLAPPRDRLDQ
jgi:hypothetical protein